MKTLLAGSQARATQKAAPPERGGTRLTTEAGAVCGPPRQWRSVARDRRGGERLACALVALVSLIETAAERG